MYFYVKSFYSTCHITSKKDYPLSYYLIEVYSRDFISVLIYAVTNILIILFTQKYDSWTLCGDEAYNKTEAAMTAKNRGYSRFLSNPKEEAVPLSYGRDVNDKLERNKDFRTPVDRISPEFRQIIRRTEEENGGRMNMGMDMNRNMHMNDSMVEFTLPNLSGISACYGLRARSNMAQCLFTR